MKTYQFKNSLVAYDPITGEFRWNGHLYRTRKGGKVLYYQTLDEAIAGYAKLGSEACD